MKINKVLFINGNAVGDVILSTAIIKAFHEQFPKSKITFLVRQETASLVERLPFIDEVVCYEKKDSVLPVVKKIWRYDIAICLDFKYRSAVMPFLAWIPIRAGLAHKRKLFLSHSVIRDINEENIYETQNFAGIIERSIGIKLSGDLHTLYVSPATEVEQAKVKDLLQNIAPTKLKIAIAPFSSNDAKNWSFESYKLLIEKLKQQYEVEFLLLGSKGDKERCTFDVAYMHDLRGQTTLTEVAEVLRQSDYFIGNCSGPLHMAAAAKLPIIALYGSTSAKHWAPCNKTVVLQHEIDCSPCDRKGYACEKNHECMKLITVDEVYRACEQMIDKYPKGKR